MDNSIKVKILVYFESFLLIIIIYFLTIEIILLQRPPLNFNKYIGTTMQKKLEFLEFFK
jgi:hypothetical protein